MQMESYFSQSTEVKLRDSRPELYYQVSGAPFAWLSSTCWPAAVHSCCRSLWCLTAWLPLRAGPPKLSCIEGVPMCTTFCSAVSFCFVTPNASPIQSQVGSTPSGIERPRCTKDPATQDAMLTQSEGNRATLPTGKALSHPAGTQVAQSRRLQLPR